MSITCNGSTHTYPDLLPDLQRAFSSVTSYTIQDIIVQTNAVGYKLDVSHDTVGFRVDVEDDAHHHKSVFLKHVRASDYVNTKKDWSDLRRTLLYARTEARFYKEFVPLLQAKGFASTASTFVANYELEGWIGENEVATQLADPNIDKDALPEPDKKGGLLIMECISDQMYFQDSPLTIDQSKQCLEAVADLHAAAWQDADLLQRAQDRLSLASFHLAMRNPKELAGIVESWKGFSAAFEKAFADLGLEWTPAMRNMGERTKAVAEYVSQQVSPQPTDPYATLIHGDYKSMNVFLPRDASQHNAILVDFASAGIGLGMSDLAMHIHHAIVPETLKQGEEEKLVRHYWERLTSMLGSNCDYPYELAWKHYRYAVIDYFRFFLARMWKSATPETMGRKKDNRNVSLINRSVPAACNFLMRVEAFLTETEVELRTQQAKS